jgi:uncharacterized Zn-finger protein
MFLDKDYFFPSQQDTASTSQSSMQHSANNTSTNYPITPSRIMLSVNQGEPSSNRIPAEGNLGKGKGKGHLQDSFQLGDELVRMQEQGDAPQSSAWEGDLQYHSDKEVADSHSPQSEESSSTGRERAKDYKKIHKVMLSQGSGLRSRSSASHDSGQTSQVRHLCPHPGCEKHFSTSGHARRHSRIHGNIRPFTCPQPGCLATFTRNDNLQQHRRNRHPTT